MKYTGPNSYCVLFQIEQILQEMKFAADVILKFKSEKVYVCPQLDKFCCVDVGILLLSV